MTILGEKEARKAATRGQRKAQLLSVKSIVKWTDEKDDIILQKYQTTTYEALAEMVGVSTLTLQKRMEVLGVSRERIPGGGSKKTTSLVEKKQIAETIWRQQVLSRRWI